eukprot:CAMPEP_0118896828 /NCGR_PEP_ID=MMETSP1166-20130328/4503_1 /TAXON_ID=1104430 /ORGANISM="Chrysoreinhardia sp, Strain CCMP3193" /LENGTH=219 /DNA_ID=CAMNT_0006835887 /DNA_START=14 /DNA_END=673 /DNA_ORIENTATION=-
MMIRWWPKVFASCSFLPLLAGALALQSTSSRRAFLGGGAAVCLSSSKEALASEVPSSGELLRLTRGYERIQELLLNWDAITVGSCRGLVSAAEQAQVIATNGGATCDKAPLKIQEYVGYRSVNDPLFRADKLMLRAVPLVDGDDIDDYLDAVNLWAEKAQMSSLNAYTSSWGEANPNGSKGQVNAFLDDAKFDVEESATVLKKKILTILDLPLQSPPPA